MQDFEKRARGLTIARHHSPRLGSPTGDSRGVEPAESGDRIRATFEANTGGIMDGVHADSKKLLNRTEAAEAAKNRTDWRDVMSKWSINLFKLEEKLHGQLLFAMTTYLIERYRLVEKLGLEKDKLYRFILAIQDGYMFANAYHNRVHAADVVHAAHYLLAEASDATSRLEPIDLYCCILAALVHDVGHDGLNNAFHVASQSELSRKFKGVSVLESYHLAQTFHLAQHEETNCFAGLSDEHTKHARQRLFDLVIATDMSKTSDLIKQANAKAAAFDPKAEWSPTVTKSILTFALKCADLSNPAKAIDISQLWASRIMTEFFFVGDLERGKGLAVSNNCDREGTSTPKCQAGFSQFVIVPLFKCALHFFPKAGPIVRLCEDNLNYWRCKDPEFKLPSPKIDSPALSLTSMTHDVKQLIEYHMRVGAQNLRVQLLEEHGGMKIMVKEAFKPPTPPTVESPYSPNRQGESQGFLPAPGAEESICEDSPLVMLVASPTLSSKPDGSSTARLPPLSPPLLLPAAMKAGGSKTHRSPRRMRPTKERVRKERSPPRRRVFRQNSDRAYMPHALWEPHRVPLTVQNHTDPGGSLVSGGLVVTGDAGRSRRHRSPVKGCHQGGLSRVADPKQVSFKPLPGQPNTPMPTPLPVLPEIRIEIEKSSTTKIRNLISSASSPPSSPRGTMRQLPQFSPDYSSGMLGGSGLEGSSRQAFLPGTAEVAERIWSKGTERAGEASGEWGTPCGVVGALDEVIKGLDAERGRNGETGGFIHSPGNIAMWSQGLESLLDEHIGELRAIEQLAPEHAPVEVSYFRRHGIVMRVLETDDRGELLGSMHHLKPLLTKTAKVFHAEGKRETRLWENHRHRPPKEPPVEGSTSPRSPRVRKAAKAAAGADRAGQPNKLSVAL